MHSKYTFSQFMHSLGIEPITSALLMHCSTIHATGTPPYCKWFISNEQQRPIMVWRSWIQPYVKELWMHLYEKSGVCCTFSGLVSQHSCISACRQWNCTSSGLPSAGLSPFDSFLAICSWCWPMHGLRPDSSSYRTMPYENMSTWNTDDSVI